MTEGETQAEAQGNALDCVLVALEGYMKVNRSIPKGGLAGRRVVLPSLVTAKFAVDAAMRRRKWSKVKLAGAMGMPENSVRCLLDLRHGSHMWVIDEALAKMNAELSIDPEPRITKERGLK